MDIDLLTKEKIIVERFIIHPRFLEKPIESIMEQIKTKLEGYRHRQGFVLKFKEIVATNDLISVRDSLTGEYSMDCTLLVDTLNIGPGNILLGCKIKMITDTGILAHTLDNHIKIFIPTDELLDEFQTLYKKGSLIDIEVLGSRDIIYDNEIIITAKILTHKAISRRLFLYNLTNNNSTARDFEGGLNVLKKMPDKENQRVYEILGYPTGKQLDLYRLISSKKFTPKQIHDVNPYAFIRTKSGPLQEVINVFKYLTKGVSKINDKTLQQVLSKVSISKSPDLAYYKATSPENMKSILNNLRTNKANKFIINLESPIDNLFKADWVYLLASQVCDKLWIYRPKCISPLNLDYSVYLVGMGVHSDKIPNLGKIGKNASKLFDGNLPDDFVSTIRIFNELLYQLYLEYGIRLIEQPDFINDPNVRDRQNQLSKEWEGIFGV